MRFPRSGGILLHPTSLPSRFGIGDLGPEAYRFADFLAEAGLRLWQVLPLGPTGYGDSPYQCFSAFAGNPLLVSLERLAEDGLLDACDLEDSPEFAEGFVDYGAVIRWKLPLLKKAHENFQARAGAALREEFEAFCRTEAGWLDDYALFMAAKHAHGGESIWTRWEPDLAARRPDAVNHWRAECASEIERHKFAQFLFFRQWEALRVYCGERGIRMMGDIPIYVAHDSADVWAHPELFQLNRNGDPTVVAGVPPDYFSSTGQLWGNPIYRWDTLERSGFAWWIERFRHVLRLVDIVRLDHFRSFEAYWEVPAGETTAVNGRWVKGPGASLFEALEKALGELPIVAENLGVITPEVEALRERFGFPGMSILQFAFGNDPQAPDFQPHNYPRDRVAYTGTHDNDTTAGWWASTGEGDSTRTPEEVRQEKARAMEYLNTDGSEMHWVFIRTLMASAADTVLFPLQDVLGLGSEARMNRPAKESGNWRWRFRREALSAELAARLKRLTELYGR